MSQKTIVIGLGILIVAQILIFNAFMYDNLSRLDTRLAEFESQYRQLESEKSFIEAKHRKLVAIVKSIPPWLLAGFEDPEAGFMKFLDFLQNDEFRGIVDTVSLQRQGFTNSPIPMHMSEFRFRYEFEDTYQAEKFLDDLVFQEKYPLAVTNITASRTKEGVVGGDLSVTLMIPAKLAVKPPFTQPESGSK